MQLTLDFSEPFYPGDLLRLSVEYTNEMGYRWNAKDKLKIERYNARHDCYYVTSPPCRQHFCVRGDTVRAHWTR